MAETETLIREPSSLEIKSTAFGEAVLLENIGNVALLSISGRNSQGISELDTVPASSVSLGRDTWQYDVADWLDEWASETPATDAQALTDETFKMIDLLDVYREGRTEITELDDERQRLSGSAGKLAVVKAEMLDLMEEEIEQRGGRDAVLASPELQAEIVQLAGEKQEQISLARDQRLEQLASTTAAKASQLEAEIGEQIEEFKRTGNTTVQKLIYPIRRLVQIGMISVGDSITGFTNQHVRFGRGPVAQKMAVMIPTELNALQLPIAIENVPELVEKIRAEAKNKPSIWG